MILNDPIENLVKTANAIKTNDIPDDVINFQKMRIIDNLACLAVGYNATGINEALDHAHRYSGCAEASVLGSSIKLAAGQAAFVNAIRSRALDFCDVISPGWHPSSSDVPIAFAIAEVTKANGKELLAAMAIGQDIGQRINLASQANGFFYRGFDSNILGLFSGTAIAARLMRLPTEKYIDALGLAFDFGIGTFQHYQDKSLAVRFSQGFVARHSIEAVMLAHAGISGPKRILEGENGFFKLYAPGVVDLSFLNRDENIQFLGKESTCFKAYPHCSILLALTEATLSVRDELDLYNLSDYHYKLKMSPTMRMVCGAPYFPTDTAQIDAQFSASYVVANALLRGTATPDDFSFKAAHDSEVVELAQRIELEEVKTFEHFDQCRLIITDKIGKCKVIDISHGRGWPENPLTENDLFNKFKMCCKLSTCITLHEKHEEIASIIDKLENYSSLYELISILGYQN